MVEESPKYIPPRLVSIDLMKCVCVVYIVAYWHLFNYTEFFPLYYNDVTVRITIVVLALFSLISGYTLGSKKFTVTPSALKTFYRARLLRIYPLFIFASLSFYALHLTDGWTLFRTVIFASIFFKPYPITLWFISMIGLFYLFTPFLSAACKNKFSYIFLSVATLLGLMILALLNSDLDLRLIMYLPSFLAGIFIAHHDEALSKARLLPIFCGFILSLVFSYTYGKSVEEDLTSIPLTLSGSLMFFYCVVKQERKLSKNSLIAFLSYASFCAYLFHRPIYKIMLDLYHPETARFEFIYLTLICVPTLFLTAWIIQKGYDYFVTLPRSKTMGSKSATL